MDEAHLVQQLHAAIPYIPVAVSLAERVRKVSCNLLVDSGIQGLATDMLCPDTHLPTPAD